MFRCTDHESYLGGRGSGDPVPCVRRPVDRARRCDGRSVPAQAPGGEAADALVQLYRRGKLRNLLRDQQKRRNPGPVGTKEDASVLPGRRPRNAFPYFRGAADDGLPLSELCRIRYNTDQGSQFTSTEYKVLLMKLQIRQSMDGKSRWADNIMIERWFRSLKTDLMAFAEE